MSANSSRSPTDRVAERRRAVALSRHFREAEGLPIAQTADRLGRSPATIKAYFYDPTGRRRARSMLSPALVALNRDAFILEASAETTVDLEGHRASSDLDELDLEEPDASAT